MEYLATVLGTVLVMLSGFWLWEHFRKQAREIEAVKVEIQKLKDENEKLMQANRSHLPYNTAEELENVLAGIVVLRQDLDIKTTILDNIEAHAKMARENKRAGMARQI